MCYNVLPGDVVTHFLLSSNGMVITIPVIRDGVQGIQTITFSRPQQIPIEHVRMIEGQTVREVVINSPAITTIMENGWYFEFDLEADLSLQETETTETQMSRPSLLIG